MTKKNGNEERTAEIMVAFRTRRTEGIRVFDEAFPLLRIFLFGASYSESVPDTGVYFGHLWLLYDLDLALGPTWLFGVSRRHEWPRGVVRTAACGGPYLKK